MRRLTSFETFVSKSLIYSQTIKNLSDVMNVRSLVTVIRAADLRTS